MKRRIQPRSLEAASCVHTVVKQGPVNGQSGQSDPIRLRLSSLLLFSESPRGKRRHSWGAMSLTPEVKAIAGLACLGFDRYRKVQHFKVTQ